MKKILSTLGVFMLGSLISLGIVAYAQNTRIIFPDVDYDHAYYSGALINMVNKGVISGYNNGNFGPNDPVTRAQVVTILNAYDQSLLNMMFEGEVGSLQKLACNLAEKADRNAVGFDKNNWEDVCFIDYPAQTDMDEETAAGLLSESGCFWDVSQEGVSTVYEAPNWVIKKTGCLGECRVNASTEEINNDDNEMCMGAE